jgi:hypothetical protein
MEKIHEELIFKELSKVYFDGIQSIKMTPVSGGFMSSIYKIQLNTENMKIPKSLIVKFQPFHCREYKLLQREVLFYKLQNKFKINSPTLISCECDENGDGFIIMEDISPCVVNNLQVSFTLENTFLVLKGLNFFSQIKKKWQKFILHIGIALMRRNFLDVIVTK